MTQVSSHLASDAAAKGDGTDWAALLRGRFVVFDGPDGSGKTTQVARWMEFAESHGVRVCHVREPGGTYLGEKIREMLLDPAHTDIDLRCELLLYMASRAQLVHRRIKPALTQGQFVLADRFVSSTLAYQGTAGGMPVQDILDVARVALADCWPHLVIIFDMDERTAARRLNPLLDRMEQKGADYHRRVRQGYLQQARDDPDQYEVMDARGDVPEVFERLQGVLKSRLGSRPASGTPGASHSP